MKNKNKVLIIFLILTAAAVFLSIWACPWPDGLESLAGKFGFEHKAVTIFKSPLPGYVWPGAGGPLATWLAAAVGVLMVFLVFQFIGFFLGRKIIRGGNR